MGHLHELVKLNKLVYGEDDADFYKNNTMMFVEKYAKTDDLVSAIRVSDIKPGGFYFFHYMDDSNWLRYSPVFVVDFKKFENMVVLICINFNFIPLPVRYSIFDPYIKEEDFQKKNFYLKVKYDVVYKELRRYGFQYSMMEYNAIQIKRVHHIDLSILPRFIWSGHPRAKYDPEKLIDIWKKKILEQDMRDKEMMNASIDEFYDVDKSISEKYDMLKKHIERIHKSLRKYGGK
jgi:hypothetical protein